MVAIAGVASVFLAVALVSLLAAASCTLIRAEDLRDPHADADAAPNPARVGLRELFRDRRVTILVASTALFHLANAPVMPLVALYVKHLDGTDSQVAQVVLVAQVTMVGVALIAGRLGDTLGRKPVMAAAFLVLPLRIFLYSLAHRPATLLALQALDGIGAGIYGVIIAVICADLTRSRGGFNTLMGVVATALALGGAVGPLCSGLVVEHLGFRAAFYLFALVAAIGAVVFVAWMPETRPVQPPLRAARPQRSAS
jgi:MFS family permease